MNSHQQQQQQHHSSSASRGGTGDFLPEPFPTASGISTGGRAYFHDAFGDNGPPNEYQYQYECHDDDDDDGDDYLGEGDCGIEGGRGGSGLMDAAMMPGKAGPGDDTTAAFGDGMAYNNQNERDNNPATKMESETMAETSFASVENNTSGVFLPFSSDGGARSVPASPSARPRKIKASIAVRMLKEELSNIPHEEKTALVHVQRINPNLVNDDHMMGHLRAEQFDVSLAAKRLVRYWEHRCRIFGADKFALPMTLTGAMKDSIDAVTIGRLILLPEQDDHGRAIIFYDSSALLSESLEVEEKIMNKMVLVWWYLIHVAMETSSAAKKGFVLLGDTKYDNHHNFSAKWKFTAQTGTSDRILPCRWQAAHFYNNRFSQIFPVISRALKALLSATQRESFIIHNSLGEELLGDLADYGLSRGCLPTSVGGNIDISKARETFLQQRQAIEGSLDLGDNVSGKTLPDKFMDGQMSRSVPSSTSQTDNANGKTPPVKGKTLPDELKDEKMPSSNIDQVQQTAKATTIPRKRKGNNSESSSTPAKIKKHPGGRGDDRMNRALNERIRDPSISFLDALLTGGYVFPGIDKPGTKKIADVVDLDGVTFYQRRNQLMRRIRWQKKKTDKGEKNGVG